MQLLMTVTSKPHVPRIIFQKFRNSWGSDGETVTGPAEALHISFMIIIKENYLALWILQKKMYVIKNDST